MKYSIRLILFNAVILALVLMITTTISDRDETETKANYKPPYTTMVMVLYSPNLTNESMDSIAQQALSQTQIYTEEQPLEPEPEPAAYQEIAEVITDDEIEMLARLLYLEARNQPIEGQRAVIEVVFNRLLSDEFQDTLYDVVYAKNQFSPARLISSTTPTEEQYEVIQTVLTETETILDRGVVFFSRGQYNDYLFDKIGDHYFCYSTKSYQNKMKGTEQ